MEFRSSRVHRGSGGETWGRRISHRRGVVHQLRGGNGAKVNLGDVTGVPMSGWSLCTPSGTAHSSSPWVGGGGVFAQSRATRHARMARAKTLVGRATKCFTRNAANTGQHGKYKSGRLPNFNGSAIVGKVAPGKRRRGAGDVTDADVTKSNF